MMGTVYVYYRKQLTNQPTNQATKQPTNQPPGAASTPVPLQSPKAKHWESLQSIESVS